MDTTIIFGSIVPYYVDKSLILSSPLDLRGEGVKLKRHTKTQRLRKNVDFHKVENLTVGSTHEVLHFDRLDLDWECLIIFPHQSGIRALWFEECSTSENNGGSQNPCPMKNETLSINKYFKENTSLSDHLNEFQGILDQMSRMDIKFEDEILDSLPESWVTFKDDHDDRVTTAKGDDLFILRDFESVNLVFDESMWIIDSSTTLHFIPRNEFFTSYTSGDFGVLKMGNDGVTKVISVGDVCLQTNTRVQLWLKGVKHATNVCFNLIFMYILDDGGYDNHFGDGKWKLTKALVAKDSVNAMDMEASLWHRRLSHISEKGLNYLANKDMLLGLKNAKLEKCSHCMTGKHTRVSFKKYPLSRKSELLELMHSDVYGPLKALVERQSGKKVKCIHFDNGGEYCGPFGVYCKKQGIRHEKTPLKTPQLNDLAERMNRTLIEIDLNTEVPNKIWFDKDVKYDHLRVFSCKAFLHVPKDERSKLDMKTR
ncbi:hypothetical protein CR513_24747, partial [Mucuna pruriens]